MTGVGSLSAGEAPSCGLTLISCACEAVGLDTSLAPPLGADRGVGGASGGHMERRSGTSGRGLRRVTDHYTLSPRGRSKLPEENKLLNWTSLQ